MKMKTLPIVQQMKCTAVKRHFISTVPLFAQRVELKRNVTYTLEFLYKKPKRIVL